MTDFEKRVEAYRRTVPMPDKVKCYCVLGYTQGAKEQQAIDKRNIIDYVHQVMPNYKDDQSMLWFLEDLLKAMEE